MRLSCQKNSTIIFYVVISSLNNLSEQNSTLFDENIIVVYFYHSKKIEIRVCTKKISYLTFAHSPYEIRDSPAKVCF